MELDEVQTWNHTARVPQVHPARVDVTSRLPSLAAEKTSCNSMDPSPPRPLPPADPPAPLPPQLYGSYEAVSMEVVPAQWLNFHTLSLQYAKCTAQPAYH